MLIKLPTDKTMNEAAVVNAGIRVDSTVPAITKLPNNLIAAVARTVTGTKIGFWTDTAFLKKELIALNDTLHSARKIGEAEKLPDVSEMKWNRKWNGLEDILYQITETITELESSVQIPVSSKRTTSASAWERFQNEDNAMGEYLAKIRSMVCEMSSKARTKWNFLAKTLEKELLFIYNCAQSLRLKLDFLNKHSGEKVDQFHVFPPVRKPSTNDGDEGNAEPYDHQYRKAMLELGREKHEFHGLLDAVKSFFEWYESPSERVKKNRSLEVH